MGLAASQKNPLVLEDQKEGRNKGETLGDARFPPGGKGRPQNSGTTFPKRGVASIQRDREGKRTGGVKGGQEGGPGQESQATTARGEGERWFCIKSSLKKRGRQGKMASREPMVPTEKKNSQGPNTHLKMLGFKDGHQGNVESMAEGELKESVGGNGEMSQG